MAEGPPIYLDVQARSVSLVNDSIALVVLKAQQGERNLVVLGPAGDEPARLGTTCGTGTIDQVLEVLGEIRLIEVTRHRDFQPRLDLDSLTLERIAEWK